MSNNIGVMTSGGDAQGMNAAVRAVVRGGIAMGCEVFGIYEGYQGLVDGGNRIRKMEWGDVSAILELGGTVIGTARCQDFRERQGRLRGAKNLLAHDIDRLVVIGGDGSLTGANNFRSEWSGLLDELLANDEITKEMAEAHRELRIIGLVGSIDNDMANTDMTIGADTALHRITDAIDAICSTAASHQRTFVVEVMGRNCGYLALMSAIATGADWLLIPEFPPEAGWEEEMGALLKAGREAGRRESIVIVAEGASDREGNPISCDYVKKSLETNLGQDVRVTILGHVQRGGAPSAFDRYMSTVLGYNAVDNLLNGDSEEESQMIGMRQNRVCSMPLMESVEKTHSIADAIAAKEYDKAMGLRGASFRAMLDIYLKMTNMVRMPEEKSGKKLRLAVLNSSWPAPGMNPAIRAALRWGIDNGHTMFGIKNGIEGLVNGDFKEMQWMDVEGCEAVGGTILGTNRKLPEGSDFYKMASNLEKNRIDGILMIGGWTGYKAIYDIYSRRREFPIFKIPMVCLPASINNNLPGCELSVGCDTALNSIVEAVDKIKHSADSSKRVFIVEVMGRYCGYLALMSGLATGAEGIYLNEDKIRLADLQRDTQTLIKAFSGGRDTALIIRNEKVNRTYTAEFMAALFGEESNKLFDVRKAILGPMQQGGNPSPFDRLQATKMAVDCMEYLIECGIDSRDDAVFLGMSDGKACFHPMEKLPKMISEKHQRPHDQWWMALRPIIKDLASRN